MKRFFYWLNIINWGIMLILIGSVASVINMQSLSEYQSTLFKYFHQLNPELTVDKSYELAKTMAIVFSIVLIITLVEIIIANFLINRDRYLVVAAIILFVTGAIVYIGTQGILLFNALAFWVSMGYCLYQYNLLRSATNNENTLFNEL